MPLNNLKLQADIVQILATLSTEQDPAAAREAYARELTAAIHAFVLSGDVTTAGTATAQRGKLT
jgi:hypothetical protein